MTSTPNHSSPPPPHPQEDQNMKRFAVRPPAVIVSDYREQLIEDLLIAIKVSTHSTSDATLARATLNSYSTALLAMLHDGATTSIIPEMNVDYMLANEGKSEEWMDLYYHVSRTSYSDEGKVCCSPRIAVNSLSLYPTMSDDTAIHYKQAAALTSTVIEIQDALKGNHPEVEKRLLSYVTSNKDGKGQLVRLANDHLVNLILNDSDCWEEVTAVMIERHTDDVDLISSIINARYSRPLSTGTL